jgi:hypothetical protein
MAEHSETQPENRPIKTLYQSAQSGLVASKAAPYQRSKFALGSRIHRCRRSGYPEIPRPTERSFKLLESVAEQKPMRSGGRGDQHTIYPLFRRMLPADPSDEKTD